MIPSSKSRDTKTEALERTPPDPLAIHQATEDTKLGIRKGTGTTSDNLGFWQLLRTREMVMVTIKWLYGYYMLLYG
jgi:hypothetical protein